MIRRKNSVDWMLFSAGQFFWPLLIDGKVDILDCLSTNFVAAAGGFGQVTTDSVEKLR